MMQKFKVEEAAKYLNVSIDCLRKASSTKTLKGYYAPTYYKDRRRLYYSKSELDRWLRHVNPPKSSKKIYNPAHLSLGCCANDY